MNNPAVIRIEGPGCYLDPVEGIERNEWYVFPADALGDPAGKVYAVRDHRRALALAYRMCIDRHLILDNDSSPA